MHVRLAEALDTQRRRARRDSEIRFAVAALIPPPDQLAPVLHAIAAKDAAACSAA